MAGKWKITLKRNSIQWSFGIGMLLLAASVFLQAAARGVPGFGQWYASHVYSLLALVYELLKTKSGKPLFMRIPRLL